MVWFRRCELEKDGREGDVKASRGQGECDKYFYPSLPTTSSEHQKWPPRRGWILKLHAISKLHYKYHSTELKQWVHCDFSDPTIFSSCRNNARISV